MKHDKPGVLSMVSNLIVLDSSSALVVPNRCMQKAEI